MRKDFSSMKIYKFVHSRRVLKNNIIAKLFVKIFANAVKNSLPVTTLNSTGCPIQNIHSEKYNFQFLALYNLFCI